jgi:uncharacterized protein with ATP-grasp and redox domains
MIDKKLYYNTQREPIRLPEYGRHVQQMVDYIKTIPSKEERNRLAQVVINVMANMNPSQKDSPEYKIKLWNHLAQIANYELDIDYPVPIYKKEDFKLFRRKIEYPQKNKQWRHYGANTVEMIKAISKIEDTEKREKLLLDLANHMKRQYLMFKKEAANGEQIKADIKTISGNDDIIGSDFKLNDTRDIYKSKSKQNNNGNNNDNKDKQKQ